jgi:hypothetical protein
MRKRLKKSHLMRLVRFEYLGYLPFRPEVVSSTAPGGVDPDALTAVLQRVHEAGLGYVGAGEWSAAGFVPNSWWAETCDSEGRTWGVADAPSMLAALLTLVSLKPMMVGENSPRWVAWVGDETRQPIPAGLKKPSRIRLVKDEAAKVLNSGQTFLLERGPDSVHHLRPCSLYVKPGGMLCPGRLAENPSLRLVGFRPDAEATDVEVDVDAFYRRPQQVVGMFAVVKHPEGGLSTDTEPIESVRVAPVAVS